MHTGRGGKSGGLTYCKCKLVLCSSVCYDFFHNGLGLSCWTGGGLDQYREAKIADVERRHPSSKRRKKAEEEKDNPRGSLIIDKDGNIREFVYSDAVRESS